MIASIVHQTTLFLILVIFSCKNCGTTDHASTTDFIISERDLIPEGTAFDERTSTVYIGSTFKRKIIQISPKGVISDFIPSKFEGLESIVGIEVDEKRDLLWSCTGQAHAVMPMIDPDTTQDWMTGVWSFDIGDRKKVKQYDLDVGVAFLNDLTVIDNGDVYITETVNGIIYKIPSLTDSLELFLQPGGYHFLNGITSVPGTNLLYVAAAEGILRIDARNKQYQLLKEAEGINSANIDGLAYYNTKLIGHQSSRVSIFHLNSSQDEITKVDMMDEGPEFDSSTTGEIGKGNYYYIVNSQIRSAIDTVLHNIKSVDQLKDVIIRKKALSN